MVNYIFTKMMKTFESRNRVAAQLLGLFLCSSIIFCVEKLNLLNEFWGSKKKKATGEFSLERKKVTKELVSSFFSNSSIEVSV